LQIDEVVEGLGVLEALPDKVSLQEAILIIVVMIIRKGV
jgi:hypothetical protein